MGIHLLAPGCGQGLLHWEVFAGFRGSTDFRAKGQTVCCTSLLLLVSGSSFPSWKLYSGAEIHAPWPIPSSILGMSWTSLSQDFLNPNQKNRVYQSSLCLLDFGRINQVPPEINVELLRTITGLLGYGSSVVRDSLESFQHIRCICDSPPKWQNHR